MAAVSEGRWRFRAEDIRWAPQQEARLLAAVRPVQFYRYPGVAQLVARLLWEQDAASSSLATWTISLWNHGYNGSIGILYFRKAIQIRL